MSEHGHSHGHGAETKTPPKPKTESEKAFRSDMPVPKRKFMDKVRGLFRSTEEPNPEEINLFKHELVDNKKNLLAEIDRTIKGEVNLVVEDIDQQTKVVEGMFEHNLLNAAEVQNLLAKLRDKKTEAQKAASVVMGELSRIDPDFQTYTQPKEKKQIAPEKRYKRASEIFAAIQKGDLMSADDLTAEEKQLMINTLSEKFKAFSYAYQPEKKYKILNPYRDDDDIDETNDKKIDSEREYEFYLELANRIGFDGRLDITPKKKPETYTMIITGQKRKKPAVEKAQEQAPHANHDAHHKPTETHTTNTEHTPGSHAPQHVGPKHESQSGGGEETKKTHEPKNSTEQTPTTPNTEKKPADTHDQPHTDKPVHDTAGPEKHAHADSHPIKPVEKKPKVEAKKPEQILVEKLRTGDHFVVLRLVNSITNREINANNVKFVLEALVLKDKVFPQPDKIIRYLAYKSLKLNNIELAKNIAEVGSDESQKEMTKSLVKTFELINGGELKTKEELEQNIDIITDENLRDDLIILALGDIAKISPDLAKEYFNKLSSGTAKNEALLKLSSENPDLVKELRAEG